MPDPINIHGIKADVVIDEEDAIHTCAAATAADRLLPTTPLRTRGSTGHPIVTARAHSMLRLLCIYGVDEEILEASGRVVQR